MTDLDFERYGFFGDSRYPVIYQHGNTPHGDNTMAVFNAGVEAGVTHIEVDGRATKGKELLARHNHLLDDGVTLVSSLSVADRIAAQRDYPDLVLVDNVYEAYPGHGISLDPKPDDAVWNIGDYSHYDPGAALAVKIIDRHNAEKRTAFGSFATQNLEIGRAAFPDMVTTTSIEELIEIAKMIEDPHHVPEIKIEGKIASVPEIETDFGFGRVITPEFLAMCHKLGLRVHAWTYDDPEDIRRLLGMGEGIDGWYADGPAVSIDVARQLGRWPVAGG